MQETMNVKQRVFSIGCIFLITVAAASGLLLLCGANLAEAYSLFFRGIFGNTTAFAEIFVKGCPLILASLGCVVAFRTGFFNIGAEGQFYVGAMSSTIVVLGTESLPGPIQIALGLIVGFVTGGIWALIAALLKAKFNLSEIIVTIMLNYIAINFLGYAVRSFLMDPMGNVPQSAKMPEKAQLPLLISGTRFHLGILFAVILVCLVWFLMNKTIVGYELKAVGLNSRGAYCAGISVAKNIIISAFLSGGLAGFAGCIEVLAIQKKLLEGISSGCGYTAVLIALIAGNQPFGALCAALIYAATQVGASSMQRQLGVPQAIVDIIIGLVVVLILAKSLFVYKKRKAKEREVTE